MRFPRYPVAPRQLTTQVAASLLCLTILSGPVLAQSAPAGDTALGDPPVLRMSATLDELYDDNLTRSSSAVGTGSEFITHAAAGGSFHRGYGQQSVDADLNVGRSLFRWHPGQDFTAVNWMLAGGSELGRDGHVGLGMRQTSDLLPLENFQSLVRDVITNRVLTLDAREDIGVRLRLEGQLSHGWYTNDNVLYTYNDNQSNNGSLGIVYRPSADTYFGVRVAGATVTYSTLLTPAVAAQVAVPGFPQTAATNVLNNYTERQLAPYFSWTPSNGITFKGNLGEVDRTYDALPNQNVRSLFGVLALEYDRSGRISGGLSLHRDLGGSTLLASRLVETDGIEVHGRYALDSLTRVDARLSADRRRYSVDQAGYPAHREYENLCNLSATHDLQRNLSLGLDYTGDWRRANPAIFGYTDHRMMLRLRFQS